MKLFKKTGLNDIDVQHEELFMRMESLAQALKERDSSSSSSSSSSSAIQALDYLDYYAATHFHYEEQGMSLYNYSQKDQHIHQHLVFSTQLRVLRKKIGGQEHFQATEILIFLRNWFISHINVADMEYAAFLTSKNNSNNSSNK